MYRFHTKSICIVTIWHQKIIIQNVLDPVHNVTFSHQFILEVNSKSVKFIQDVYPNKEWKAEEVTVICDCVEGIKGKMCFHSVAQYYRLGMMKKPFLIPENQRFSKATHGKVPGARKQIHY